MKSLSFTALLIALSISLGTVHAASYPQHYGPYPSSSPDSGTCGNNWAQDSFDRHFTITKNSDNSYLVVEQFKDGSFVTNAGSSPGACQTPPPSTGLGGTVNAGVTGEMYGYFNIPISNLSTQNSTDPHCNANLKTNANCDTTTFINTHFNPPCYPAICTVTTFFFHYHADDQCLIEHTWQNASPDVGGNKGDIRSGTGTCVCHESDGNGDFQGQQSGNFNSDNDGCMDGDQNQVSSTNRGDGKDFQSTQIDTTTFDPVANKLTITGIGVSGGVPVTFVFIALETGPTTPGWVSFAFSDGYTNAGTLVNGSILLH